jgi:tetratricopeptide (TPR) repeat protein
VFMRDRNSRVAFVLSIANLAIFTACHHEPPTPPPLAPVDAAPKTNPIDASIDADVDASTALAWPEAVRMERWVDAARAIDALPQTERDQPEVKYARARAALAIGKAADAEKLLEGLETALPLLREDIERHRAEARLIAGPFEAAAEYYSMHFTPSAQLHAAEAYEKAGDFVRARASCDRVLGMEGRSRSQEANARAIRLHLANATRANATGDAVSSAARDARWLAVHGADLGMAQMADAAMMQLDPSHPLSGDEWMTRAHLLADAGDANGALGAVRQAASTPSRPSERARWATRISNRIRTTTRRRKSSRAHRKMAECTRRKMRSMRRDRSNAPTMMITRCPR